MVNSMMAIIVVCNSKRGLKQTWAGGKKNRIDEIVGGSIRASLNNCLKTVASTVGGQWRRLGKRNISIFLYTCTGERKKAKMDDLVKQESKKLVRAEARQT